MAEKSKATETGPLSFNDLPKEAMEEIFLRVPFLDLVPSCRMVCRRWAEILSDRVFWHRFQKRHIRHDSSNPYRKISYLRTHVNQLASTEHEAWQFTAYADPLLLGNVYGNLLKNPDGSKPGSATPFEDWDMVVKDGQGWSITKEKLPHPVVSEPMLWKSLPRSQQGADMNFPFDIETETDTRPAHRFLATSGTCLKGQLVDLKKLGCPGIFKIKDKDRYTLTLNANEWVRVVGPCQYRLVVKALNKEMKVITCTTQAVNKTGKFVDPAADWEALARWEPVSLDLLLCFPHPDHEVYFLEYLHGFDISSTTGPVDPRCRVEVAGCTMKLNWPTLTKITYWPFPSWMVR